jgi:hypothetical protein
MSIVREFLLACNLDYTIAVFDPEINAVFRFYIKSIKFT